MKFSNYLVQLWVHSSDVLKIFLHLIVTEMFMIQSFITFSMFLTLLMKRILKSDSGSIWLTQGRFQLCNVSFCSIIEGDSFLLTDSSHMMQDCAEFYYLIFQPFCVLLWMLFSVIELLQKISIEVLFTNFTACWSNLDLSVNSEHFIWWWLSYHFFWHFLIHFCHDEWEKCDEFKTRQYLWCEEQFQSWYCCWWVWQCLLHS